MEIIDRPQRKTFIVVVIPKLKKEIINILSKLPFLDSIPLGNSYFILQTNIFIFIFVDFLEVFIFEIFNPKTNEQKMKKSKNIFQSQKEILAKKTRKAVKIHRK